MVVCLRRRNDASIAQHAQRVPGAGTCAPPWPLPTAFSLACPVCPPASCLSLTSCLARRRHAMDKIKRMVVGKQEEGQAPAPPSPTGGLQQVAGASRGAHGWAELCRGSVQGSNR